jgi:hypothetical protein
MTKRIRATARLRSPGASKAPLVIHRFAELGSGSGLAENDIMVCDSEVDALCGAAENKLSGLAQASMSLSYLTASLTAG